MKLIVYYSYTGNTSSLADIIKEKLNCDIVKLETITNYSSNYEEVVDQAKIDVNNNYMPELKTIINLEKYDTIILGTPVWWYTFSSPINTFLNKYDLSNKKIIPFVTNGGWLGHTIKDIQKLCPNVENPISIKYNGNKLVEEEKFYEWLERIDK